MLRKAAAKASRFAQVKHNFIFYGSRLPCFSQEGSSRVHDNAYFARGLSGQIDAVREQPHQDKSLRVRKLADEILQLNLLELSDLTEIFQERLGIPNIGSLGYGAPAAAPGAGPQAAPAEAPAEEQTDFDIKLESFEAAAKIKVIKEIRSLSDLGLKEAKELVEKAPVTVKTGLKKEEAEELKKKLEAVGGKVSLV